MRAPGKAVVLATLALAAALEGALGEGNAAYGSNLEAYKSLFSLKRREHIETAEKVWSVDDYGKQYKTVAYLLDAIFPILVKSKAAIVEARYVPNSPFPEDEQLRDAISQVYENVIFFGDFLLRMPDITKQIYRKHKEWHPVLQWAMQFCAESTEVFSGPHAYQLHLMAQEIGIIPEEPNYVNPFRMQRNSNAAEERKKPKKKEVKKTRGPKLRGVRRSEL